MIANAESHLLCIRHVTHYRYAFPVTFEPHRLVLRPREGHDLRVEELRLELTPAAELVWTRDIFGNTVTRANFREPASEAAPGTSSPRRTWHPSWTIPASGRALECENFTYLPRR